MYEFNYHRPGSVDEAVELLKSCDDGTVLAGGHTLLPTMKQRLASPSDLIDITGAVKTGIDVSGGNVVIGAGTCHADVAASLEVQNAIPALARLAGGIGDPHVRRRGTIGGSVANNDPAADYPAACVGLGATIVTSKREMSADEFFTGMFETALDDDEIVTSVRFPVPAKAGYAKFPNPASRYALVGVFVASAGGGARVAVTGAGASVFRVAEMESALGGDFSSSAIDGMSVSDGDLNGDIHASAEYRAHLVGVMARRAVDQANG
jgi:carbon-monoxide dehydrogenase medium subunit